MKLHRKCVPVESICNYTFKTNVFNLYTLYYFIEYKNEYYCFYFLFIIG